MYRPRNGFLLLLSGLLCILAACGTASVSRSPSSAVLTTSVDRNTIPNTPAQTLPVPPTQTSCPTAGTARAMVTAPLAFGHHQTIVYTVDEGMEDAPTFGTLKRFDVVTGAKVEILKQAKLWVDHAQLSADGQWILFVTKTSTQDKLQLVRMDGQGLQTLYCAPRFQINSPQWSTNQQWIVFSRFLSQPNSQTIYLLNTKTGKLQSEFTAQTKNGTQDYAIRTWLDNIRIYLTGTNIDQPPTDLYILDITKGANQTPDDLLTVVKRSSKGNSVFIGELDSSYDGRQLFVDHGVCGQGGCFPPSDITVQPALGGAQKTIFSSKQYDAISIRAVTSSKLLIIIFNSIGPAGGSVDTSHNGLWIMNTDGSDLKRLTIDNSTTQTLLNPNSQYPWSNVSRDGKYYVAQINNFQHQQNVFSLVYGSLTGGPATTFVSLGDNNTIFDIVGWTTM